MLALCRVGCRSALAWLLVVAFAATAVAAPSGAADPDRRHAGPHRPARADRAAAQDRRRDLRRRAEQGQRPARPPRGVGAARRPVQARPHPQPLREADHRRQGRPPDRALRHRARSSPPWAWPSATRSSSSHHSFGMPHLAKYEMHFPDRAPSGPSPTARSRPSCSTRWPPRAKPPKTVAIVTSKFPSAQFQSRRAPARWREKRGLKVALYLEYEFGTRDCGRDRGAGQGCQSRLPVGRRARPRRQPAPGGDEEARLHAAAPLPPVPGAGPLALAPDGKLALSTTVFEEHPPFTNNAGGGAAGAALPRAGHQGRTCPTRTSTRRRPASFAAWQILEAAVTATKSLDDKVLAQWLRDEPGRHDHRQAALRRAQQLRRRPVQGEAGAGRQVGGGVAEGVRRARRPAAAALIDARRADAAACRA